MFWYTWSANQSKDWICQLLNSEPSLTEISKNLPNGYGWKLYDPQTDPKKYNT